MATTRLGWREMRTALKLTAGLAILAVLYSPQSGRASAKNTPGNRTHVTIENPHCLDVPAQHVQVVHEIVCRVVAEEFQVDEAKVDCRLRLVLGEEKDRSAADEANGIYTVYLISWDEPAFAISDMRLAVQRMVSPDRWQHMTHEIIRRVDRLAPVDAHTFQKPPTALLPPSGGSGKCPRVSPD
jgi:hypothetical protein